MPDISKYDFGESTPPASKFLLFTNILYNSSTAAEITTNATAKSELILRQATTAAKQELEMAHHNGLKLLQERLDIVDEDHKASLHWLRTMQRHLNMNFGVNYADYKLHILNAQELP